MLGSASRTRSVALSGGPTRPGPGTRLPLIMGWAAYPGYSRYYYRDYGANAPNLRLFDTIPRPNGYFFVLPTVLANDETSGEPCHAILCRTLTDAELADKRPRARYDALQRVQI